MPGRCFLVQTRTFIHVRVIAFYLPQFHPIPENDAWVGQGIHRMDECHESTSAFSRALSAAFASATISLVVGIDGCKKAASFSAV